MDSNSLPPTLLNFLDIMLSEYDCYLGFLVKHLIFVYVLTFLCFGIVYTCFY